MKQTAKLRYVDALRGVAVLGVMLVYTGLHDMNNHHILVRDFITNGARGVQLFFLVSAFTIFISYNKRAGSEVNLARNFFLRRFFRIAPLYYLGILYFLWQNYYLGDIKFPAFAEVLAQFTFVHGANPYWINHLVPGGWSIAVEMTFYALVPLLVPRIKNTDQAINFIIIVILFADVLNYIFVKNPLVSDVAVWQEYLFTYFPSQLPLFGFGIVAYFVIIRQDLTIKPLTILIAALLFIGQLIWGIFVFQHVLFGLGFLFLLIALSQREFAIIVNQPTCYLGKISFNAYLVHFAVLYWMTRLDRIHFIAVDTALDVLINFGIRFAVVASVTVLISSLSYLLVEERFILLGKRMIARLS